MFYKGSFLIVSMGTWDSVCELQELVEMAGTKIKSTVCISFCFVYFSFFNIPAGTNLSCLA